MSRIALLSFALAITATAAPRAAAQSSATSDPRRPFATREALTGQLAQIEAARRAPAAPPALGESARAEAWLLRRRLEHGDFVSGDRIALWVEGQPALSDTFVVREDRTLWLPDIASVSLTGVLRAELQSHLGSALSRFLVAPRIRAEPLVRLSISGAIAQPGFYAVPADALLSDVIMVGGGPAGTADLRRSLIRRGSNQMWSPRDFQVALSDGMTVDQLHLRAGDEIVVGEKKTTSWVSGVQIATGVLSLALTIYYTALRR